MAKYLAESNALFHHIPRTGGTWVERWLGYLDIPVLNWVDRQPKHLPRKHSLISHFHPWHMRRVKFVFSFVRHPVALYESTWRWIHTRMRVKPSTCQRICTKWKWHPHAAACRWYCRDFNSWIEIMLDREPLWVTRMYEQYIGPTDGEFCHWVGRTETLVDDFLNVLGYLGYEIPKQSADACRDSGVVNGAPTHVQWRDTLKRMVEATERLAIDRFYGTNETKRFYAPLAEETDQRLAERRARPVS